jgi:hypothetical protein
LKLLSIIVNIIILSFLLTDTAFAGDTKARAKFGPTPHSETGKCSVCHVLSAESLRSPLVMGSASSSKRQLKYNLNEVCRRCHGSNFGHATGKKTEQNTANLPLGADDTITCATTCHNMHVRSDDFKQQSYHLRLPFDSLCVSCHDK